MIDERNTDNKALELDRSVSRKALLSKNFYPEVPEIPKKSPITKRIQTNVVSNVNFFGKCYNK